MAEPARVFVGCGANHEDAEAQAVAEYSLRSSASCPVEVRWLKLSPDSRSPTYSAPDRHEGWLTQGWLTPYQGLSQLVPSLCDCRGRAVYMDCTTIVMGDVAELLAMDMPRGAAVAVSPVVLANDQWLLMDGLLLWDCAAAHLRLPPLCKMQLSGPMGISDLPCHARYELPAGWGLRDTDPAFTMAGAKSVTFANRYVMPHRHLARRRLAADGRQHWFDGPVMAHWDAGLSALFSQTLRAAEASGMSPESYCRDPLFGRYE